MLPIASALGLLRGSISRELCRTKALSDAGSLDSDARIELFYERERSLLGQLHERGYPVPPPRSD